MRMPSFFSSPTFSLSFLFSGSVKMMYLTFPFPFGEALPETTVWLTGPDGLVEAEEFSCLLEEVVLPCWLELPSEEDDWDEPEESPVHLNQGLRSRIPFAPAF